jgi:hypothetical protein
VRFTRRTEDGQEQLGRDERMAAGGAAAPEREPEPEPERARVRETGVREPGERASRRRTLGLRSRDAGAAVVGTAGAGVVLLARLVMSVASLIALLIAAAIVLRDVDANGANTIVKGVHEGANFFAGAFTGLIRFNGHPKRAITVDWGIALLAYLIVGAIVSGAIARIGRGGLRFERTHHTVTTH